MYLSVNFRVIIEFEVGGKKNMEKEYCIFRLF